MLLFLLKRIGAGLVLLVAATAGTFFLAHLAISDPTAALLGSTATPEQQAALALKLGLDRPVLVQFLEWAGHAVRGDLGLSWRSFQPVSEQILQRVPVTLSIVTFALLLAALFGTLFGVLAGLNPGGVFDRVIQAVTVVLFALPGFWLSLVLVLWFAVRLQWFPAIGYVSPADSMTGWLRSITLPSVSLALGAIVMVAEQLRNQVMTVSRLDYIRTLKSRGLPKSRIRLHVLRNAAPTAITVLAVMFTGLLSGAVVVEAIFSMPGLGQLTQSSAQMGDIPMLLGITAATVFFLVLVYILLDIVLGWVNPKVRIR